jgi:N-acetylglutamate synthase-like GNAT family acetyltransferase
MSKIEIDTKKEKLDISFIHEFISNSYWAKGRTVEAMKTCIDNSLNFGVYLNDKQIGYARLVTDYAVFAYIMDVFIDANYRGNGYSKQLVEYIMNLQELSNVKVWRLATSDAHGLYKKFGFKELNKPENFMELIKSNKD